MGATKLLAERLVAAAHRFFCGQTLCAVRFGNVLGSRGSLAPRILNQLGEEGCASLTHSEMTRFMMTIDDAVALVLAAGARGRGGETFIFQMPSLRVRDLVEVLVEYHANTVGRPVAEFPIRTIGIRPGEKLHETLITEDERRRARLVRDGLIVVEPPDRGPAPREYRELDLPLDSSQGPFLDRQAIVELLLRSGALNGVSTRESTLPSLTHDDRPLERLTCRA